MAADFMHDEKAEDEVRESFTRMLVRVSDAKYPVTLRADWVRTPVGSMLAAGDDKHLYLLDYIQRATMERKAALLQRRLNARLEIGGASGAVKSIADELAAYFAGELREFRTPLMLTGTAFQVMVWEELRKIPFGATISYGELARRIGKPSAFRAAAQANGQNPVAIVVPCHRIINTNGKLGGYSAGLDRKQWLLDFERKALAKGHKARAPQGATS